MKTTSIIPTCVAFAALLALALAPAAAHAQGGSATRALTTGGFVAAGGASGSTLHGIAGSSAAALGQARASSAAFDVVPGVVGGAYSAQATLQLVTTANAYAGVSFALTPPNNLVTALFDTLDGYDSTKWRLGHWSPADSAYQEPGGALALTRCSPGQGYWLITKDARTVAAKGLPAPVGPFAIPLASHPGLNGSAPRPAWNQVCNPFLFPVDVSALQVTDGVNTYLLGNAVNPLVDNVVKVWTDGAYASATVLAPNTAYWVHTKGGASQVQLVVPYLASASAGNVPELAKPAGADWAVALLARRGTQHCEPVLLGATTTPAGPAGPLERVAAPQPPGGGCLSLVASRPDRGGDDVWLFQPQAARMAWDLVAQTDASPGELSLDLRGFDVPAGTRFWLAGHGGSPREVTLGQAVTLAVGGGATAFTLAVTAPGAPPPAGVTPVADALRRVAPNPFAGAAGLTFTLARDGDVAVEIFDVAGRVVRRLERLGIGPGEHVLVWDGRDAQGRALASGVYLARYRAGSAHGVARLVRVE